MYPDLDTIKDILLSGNYISAEDSANAEHDAGGTTDGYIAYLIREELLNKTLLGQAIAESYHVPYIDLDRTPPNQADVAQIPEQLARQQHVVFVRTNERAVAIASDSPDKVNTKALQSLFSGKKIHIGYALPEYISTAFAFYAQPLETRFTSIIAQGSRVAPGLVDAIIADAVRLRASDIHIEPQDSEVAVRLRVDGLLRQAGSLPMDYYDNILNRIKVASGMRIDEHFFAQDGSIHHVSDEGTTDLRVSLVPTIHGEKVVMRLLGSYTQSYNLSDLGLNEEHRKQYEAAAAKPFGMILTTGPTGSGKTTSLYALLEMLNRPDVNITTIEDPVEYQIAGVNQIQVRRTSELDFANGLRAIVRQDPDVILVGEIRDKETAEISVNAALTGHLLLSTFHANDAASAIPRLIDMGIEPFLLASTLEIIIAQRLVRKLCTQCRTGIPISKALETLPAGGKNTKNMARYFGKDDTVYTSNGCGGCNDTGYMGRSALYETIQITPAMQELIVTNPSTRQIADLAAQELNRPMFDDGIEKVKGGVTTISEILRVVEPPANRPPVSLKPVKTAHTS